MFGKTRTAPEPVAATTSGVNLTKGGSARLTKTAVVTATTSWSTSTDYDLYALVVDRDGAVHHVAMFGAAGQPACASWRGVVHKGDVGRAAGGQGIAVETLEITLSDDIAAVVPVAYSAQSNGTGSFRRYRVSLAVTNGTGEQATVDASNASSNDTVYTCVPAVIYNRADGVVVEHLEAYSKPGSENRPAAELRPDGTVRVRMDAGPRNDYK